MTHQPHTPSVLDVSVPIPHVTIYSDGSYKPTISYGGYGTLVTCANHGMLIYGGTPNSTNNQMELTAVLTALRRLDRPCEVTVVSDSRYVVDTLNGFIWNWANNDWRTSKNKPVVNVELWKEMLTMCQVHRIHAQWIKGHTGYPENEACDRLATYGAFAAASLPQPTQPVSQPYPGDEDEQAYIPFEYKHLR